MALTAPSSTLTGQTIASSYDQLLFLDAAAGVTEATLKIVSGTAGKTALQLSDEHVLIKGVDTNNAAGFEVQQTDGTSILKVAAGTPSVLVSGSGTKLYFSDAGGEYISGDGSDLTITSGNDIKFTVGSGGSVYHTGDGGSNNTIYGLDAGVALTSGGDNNVVIGDNAGNDLTTGDQNTIVGHQAGDALVGGEDNTFIGQSAGGATTAGTSMTIVGRNAGTGVLTADAVGTVLVGYGSGAALTEGAKNIAIGYDALGDNIEGDNNIAIGYEAMNAMLGQTGEANTGDDNIGIGTDALGSVDAGTHNNAKSNANIAIGTNALLGGDFNTSDLVLVGNIAIGYQALDATAANQQRGLVAIGYQALSSLTSGVQNMAIGYNAMATHTTGGYNTVIGYAAMGDTDEGSNSLASQQNVFVGRNVGGGQWTDAACDYNVAVGDGALAANLAGVDGIVAVGRKALAALTSGAGNTAVGFEALKTTATGAYNTAVGYAAADALVDGSDGNTAIGYNALTAGNNDSTHDNTAVGYNAADALTTGSNNTFIGAHVAGTAATNTNCTVIGRSAQVSGDGTANETVIGYTATGQAANTVVLGNGDVTDVYMAQDGGATVSGAGYHADNNTVTSGNIFYAESSSLTTGTAMTLLSDGTALTSTAAGGFVEIKHTGNTGATANNLLYIKNQNSSSSATTCLLIDQDATAGAGLTIDSEAQTNYCLGIVTPQTTTSTVFSISDANSLTSGSIATFESNSSSNTARRLVRIINDNAATDNAVGLHIQQDGNGASIELSGAGNCGIKFPATVGPSSDVNTLDDYEEGTWTPTMTFGGNSVSVAYAIQSGRYTKVGRLVQIECKLELSNNGSSTGTAAIGGLPFTPAGDSAGCGDTDNVSFANQLSFMIVGSAVLVYLNESTEGGARTTITEGEVANDAQIRIMVTYVV